MTSTLHTSGIAQQLDVLGFPLTGSHLIEASAGTGKTFTIALLYVRLVLGHGRGNPHERGLTPPEILVMTFTDAATQELRDRIRARLTEAAEYFRQTPDEVKPLTKGENLLHDLRDEYPVDQWALCARKLQLAAEWMDEAAVSTIHAWCHRMLREHAFDSDSPFSQQLETDQRELYTEAVRDYWRTFLTPLSTADAREVAGWWSDPDGLEKSLKSLTQHPEFFTPCPPPEESLRACQRLKSQSLSELKAPWAEWLNEMRDLLDAAYTEGRVNRKKLQPRFYDPWLGALDAWITDETQVRPELKTGWTRLTPPGMAEVWSDGIPPEHPALDAIAALPAALDSLPSARNDILRHGAHWVGDRFQQEQTRRAQMGFNDLLTRLREALKGPNGERLATLIRQQFPAALIDEFQDTDPIQYEIFDQVYQVADPAPDTTLILIGDPKQAIYAFRGADIFTYLQARQATAGRHHTLKINHRSTREMVGACNVWFELAEGNSGAGAFLFRAPDRHNPLPFVSAEARGREEALFIAGEAASAITVWWLPAREDGKPLAKEVYYSEMAGTCASEITRLLELAQSHLAGFKGYDGFKPLQPADIAVLVNSRTEANAIRQALGQRGVRSVYLSDHDSVYQTETACDVLLWLSACAEPTDLRRLRAAMATATLALSWAELDRFNQDEAFVEHWVQRFRDYQISWSHQGVLAMIRQLLQDFSLPARLLGAAGENGLQNGERILTDLLHLAELLQHASQRLEGEHALVRFLAEQIADSSSSVTNDVRQIRLESDADLVKVVTIHKSKGLEYGLVFFPYAANFRPTKADDLPLKWHDADGQLCLDLEPSAEKLERSDRERLGEDVRKFYVALTRAKYAAWVGIAPIQNLHQSAPGYLLNGGREIDAMSLEEHLQPLADASAAIRITAAPMPTGERLTPRTSPQAGLARVSRRIVTEPWWIASYSSIKKSHGPVSRASETAAEDTFRESVTEAMTSATDPTKDSPRPAKPTEFPHTFPKGADAGTFLHDLLEWSAQQGFGIVVQNESLLRDQVARRCQLRGWAAHTDSVTQWLLDWLTTPLQLPAINGMTATPITLANLSRVVPEMEFWLPADRVDTIAMDALVTRLTLAGEPRPPIPPNWVNGLLKGFMDLVFEHEGRYYVLDYKSNVLGHNDATYTPEAMRAAILKERYDLQYVLYLLALHRHLQSRLPDYRYDQHMGGAVYLFLRGLKAPSQGLHVEKPPAELIEALDCMLSPQATTEA